MTAHAQFQDILFKELLCRHFRIFNHDFLSEADGLRITRNFIASAPYAPVYYPMISETRFVLALQKGFIGVNHGCVLFLTRSGAVYPMSSTECGVAAALMHSSAFLFAEERLSDRDRFMLDVAVSFPGVKDWASHVADAATQLKNRYKLSYFDAF